MRLLFVLAGGLVALGWGATWATAQSTVVRIATWNIEKVGDPFFDGDGVEEDLIEEAQYNAARAVLERLDADVVAINEVSSDTDIGGLQALADELGYGFVTVPSIDDNRDTNGDPLVIGFGSDRNAILTRLPVVTSEFWAPGELSTDPAAVDMTRQIVSVQVDVPGVAGDLTVFVQHWKSGDNASDRFRRAIESYRMVQATSSLDPAEDYFAIVGDINQELGENVFPAVFDSVPPALPSLFQLGGDILSAVSGDGLPTEVFSHLLPLASVVHAVQLNGDEATRLASGRRIDYVLLSSACSEQGAPLGEVYNSALDTTNAAGLPKVGMPLPSGTSTTAADHLPVVVDITLPSENICVPGPEEVCGNSTDDNCDGFINENCECSVDFDPDGTGGTSISDVQCAILLSLWQLDSSAPPPVCLSGDPASTDVDCDGLWTVSDVQILVGRALGLSVADALDTNGNECVDACDASPVSVCGDGMVTGLETCDDGEINGASPLGCQANCQLPTCGDGIVQAVLFGTVRQGEHCDDGNLVSGDGCAANCTLELSSGTGGGVVISELMTNPTAPVNDSDGEWLEVTNTTDGEVNLVGFILRDDDLDAHQILTPLVLGPGERAVLGRNGDQAANGGVELDYVYSSIQLANTADEIILEVDDTLVDRVIWDDGATFPDPNGSSMSLTPCQTTAAANDNGVNWTVATVPYGDGSQLGTPGTANGDCP